MESKKDIKDRRNKRACDILPESPTEHQDFFLFLIVIRKSENTICI